jgi:hypothetical protein
MCCVAQRSRAVLPINITSVMAMRATFVAV